MRKTATNKIRLLSVVLSLLMVLSVISLPTLKPKAAAGTIDDFVERCYTVTLGRGSDPDGFADWKGQLTNGQAVGVHVAYGFLFSPEYTKKNKSPEDYVTDLYMLFMGREPDEAGFADWVGQLKDGKSRVEVFAGFANSQEFYNICESYGITAGRFVVGYDRYQVNDVNLFVERLYKVCFNRIGDRGGQRDWVEKLIGKQITGSECARNFIQSREYENLGLSDSDYVENLYIALMGRASDAPGKADWLTKLANGMTRDEVFAGFVNSVEFDGICKKYNIERGTYTATKKGTYDPNNPNNVPVNPSEDNPSGDNPSGDNPDTPSGDNPDTPSTHTHNYNKKNTDSKYLKSAATCTKAAVYYYSCECGEKGTSTFTSGNPKGHTYNKKNTASKYLKSAATCTEKAVYYYSCECGEKDTSNTFTSGDPLGHRYDTVPNFQVLPTDTEDGVGSYSCLNGCGETKNETIPCKLSYKNVGDTIIFGQYEQDGETANGKEDIEWQILSKEDGKALVISKYALDTMPFDSSFADAAWETSQIRTWLNGDFIDEAFSSTEKSKISKVLNKNDGNEYHGTLGSNDTYDYVFCLSVKEVYTYFGENNVYWNSDKYGYKQRLLCTPTTYAVNRGAESTVISSSFYNSELKLYGYTEDALNINVCNWWLRNPGSNFIQACYVDNNGGFGDSRCGASSMSYIAVRPAIYIEYGTHTHEYNMKDTDSRYLKSAATCTEPAVYYYSCSCGGYDENNTFSYGDPSEHNFTQKNTDSKYLKSAATCTENAVYYYSCECGEYDPTQTFTKARSALGHRFVIQDTSDIYLKSAATCTEPAVYYYKCVRCDEHGAATYTYGEPLGHDCDDWTEIPATLTENGKRTGYCNRCSETVTEITSPSLLSQATEGDIIKFGKYEQDGDLINGKEDIEWRILSKEDGKVLVISEYVLDAKEYNSTLDDVSWATCSLRTWLNGDFMDEAFSDYENSKIPTVSLKNYGNPFYHSTDEADTDDRVFCLSIDEIERLFKNTYSYENSYVSYEFNKDLICTPTQIAKDNGVTWHRITEETPIQDEIDRDLYSEVIGKVSCNYWLRTKGELYCDCYAAFDGVFGGKWTSRVNSSNGVRPAMYIEYETE